MNPIPPASANRSLPSPAAALASSTAPAFCPACQATIEAAPAGGCPGCGAAEPPFGWPRDARLGQVVVGGQYRVVRRLGAGGFGTVYLVETVVGGLRRALKVLHAEWSGDPAARDRFINEALVLEQVNHPSVARCFAVGSLDDGQALYLLLEYVEGATLTRMETPLPPARAVRMAKQLASGLAAAHANGVLHRDVKPDNVVVMAAGELDEQVKLLDFGVARLLETTAAPTHGLLGTPAYLPPEQIDASHRGAPGATDVDFRADLWQLGATLFYMLTGEVPYPMTEAGLPDMLARHHAHPDLGPLPSSRRPELGTIPALDRLVARLLASRRDRRPRTAAQVCAELARVEHALAPAAAAGALALLEALCAAPSEGAWWALCRYLTDQVQDAPGLVDTANALLGDWPDQLREAPVAWWEQVRQGEPQPLWPLARTLNLGGRGLGDDDVIELAGCAALATIRRLVLSDNLVGNPGAEALATSPHLTGLEALDLADNRISSTGAAAIAASASLERLTTLSLARNGLGARGAEALAGARARYRVLDLADNDIQAAGAAALAGSGSLAGLETLDLGGNNIGSDGVGALATSRTLTSLRTLDLTHNRVGASGAAALALSANVVHLQRLSLAQNALGAQGMELLLASHRFAALEALDLSSNGFGASGAMTIAASPFSRRLKMLRLANNALGDAGLATLLGAPHLAGLRVLDVAQNDLTGAAMTLLAGAPPELEEIDLSDNAIEAAGAHALAAALPRTRIRTLRVNRCGLTGEGLCQILGPGGARLEACEAASNALGPDGARRLETVSAPPALATLDLSHDALGREGSEVVARMPLAAGLRTLRLNGNDIDDEGGQAVAKALESLPNLQDVSLAENALGPRTAAALAASPVAARLNRLNLAHNVLGDAGATALAHGPRWHALNVLDLRHNAISLGAATSVLSSPSMAVLSRVNLSHNVLGAGAVDVHSLSKTKVALLESSFAVLSAPGVDFAERFYEELFARFPSVKPLFTTASMRRQQHHLMAMLVMVIDNLRTPDLVARQLQELGARHVGYGTCPSHYFMVTGVLLDVIRQSLGDAWSAEVDEAWRDGLEAIATVMMKAPQQG